MLELRPAIAIHMQQLWLLLFGFALGGFARINQSAFLRQLTFLHARSKSSMTQGLQLAMLQPSHPYRSSLRSLPRGPQPPQAGTP